MFSDSEYMLQEILEYLNVGYSLFVIVEIWFFIDRKGFLFLIVVDLFLVSSEGCRFIYSWGVEIDRDFFSYRYRNFFVNISEYCLRQYEFFLFQCRCFCEILIYQGVESLSRIFLLRIKMMS